LAGGRVRRSRKGETVQTFRSISLICGILLGSAAALWVAIAQAANMHLERGPSWDCSLIAVDTDAGFRLYQACKACELENRQFYKTRADGGRCVRIGVSTLAPPPSVRPERVPERANIEGGRGNEERGRRPAGTVPERASVQPSRKIRMGAIAVRLKGGGWSQGSSWNYITNTEARRRAMAGCRKYGSGCKVLVTFRTCGAVSFGKGSGRTGAYGSFGVNRRDARAKALARCRRKYRNCKIIVHKCNG
jgi:hypothetical protein